MGCNTLKVNESDLKNIVYIINKIIKTINKSHEIVNEDLNIIVLLIDHSKLQSLNTFIKNNKTDYLIKLNSIKNAWITFGQPNQSAGKQDVATLLRKLKPVVQQAYNSELAREFGEFGREAAREAARGVASTASGTVQDLATVGSQAAIEQAQLALSGSTRQQSADPCDLSNQYYDLYSQYYNKCQSEAQQQMGGGDTDSQYVNNIYNLCNKYQPKKSSELDNIFLSQYSNTMTETEKEIKHKILQGNSLYTVDE